jgi:hypothetical protein
MIPEYAVLSMRRTSRDGKPLNEGSQETRIKSSSVEKGYLLRYTKAYGYTDNGRSSNEKVSMLHTGKSLIRKDKFSDFLTDAAVCTEGRALLIYQAKMAPPLSFTDFPPMTPSWACIG